ncbi:MAG: hypothetical protein KAI73_02085 [Rhodospirillaceae bacterium]|nr:hypothetical protein [Rhodospirillaceae bacterium]
MAEVEDKDLGFDALVVMLTELSKPINPSTFNVGFFAPEIAEYAAYNEFGTADIPERPFMRTTFDANTAKYIDLATRAVGKAVDNPQRVSFMFKPLANEVRNDIIEAIQGGPWVPNAESTAQAKGYNQPLVETGQMQRAVVIKTGKAGA